MPPAPRLTVLLVLLGTLLALPACGDDDGRDGPASGPFELSTSPEFVNMVIPGRRPLALVTATGEGTGAIDLDATASLDGAMVEILPSAIAPGAVAEIWVQIPDRAGESPFEVTITGTRGDQQRTTAVTATAVPGTDDLEPTALDIAAVFLEDLADTTEELPSSTTGLVDGTPVAGLLVVSHYAWFTDDAEIALAWHIMVAPDDWAELTIRPRGQLAPTRAFRLDSWSTALAGGDFEIEAIEPPPEVTR